MTNKNFTGWLMTALVAAALVACGGKGKAPATADKANAEMKKGETGGTTYGGAGSGAQTPANPCAGN